LQVLLHQSGIPAVVALGALLVIVSGGIDLSAGSVVALVTVVTMQVYRLAYNGPEAVLSEEWLALQRRHGLAWHGTESAVAASLVAVPAGVLAGGVCGLGNGLMVTRLRVRPFVATRGLMSVPRGLAAVWRRRPGPPLV
jgi:ribose transport system permease protein